MPLSKFIGKRQDEVPAKRERRKEARPGELLDAALDLFVEKGFAATRASGITKLIISEARNFPDIAAFYSQEVIEPGEALIRRILQRGVDSGEFHLPDLDYAVYAIIAPMIWLIMMKHSLGACVPRERSLDPQRYLRSQADILLQGMVARPDAGPDRKAGSRRGRA